MAARGGGVDCLESPRKPAARWEADGKPAAGGILDGEIQDQSAGMWLHGSKLGRWRPVDGGRWFHGKGDESGRSSHVQKRRTGTDRRARGR